MDKARFLANSICELGAWLQTLPSPNNEFRIALALPLGLPVVQPHTCYCGDKVDKFALHGLSCSKAIETNPRHGDTVNKIIQRALKSAEIPAIPLVALGQMESNQME